MGCAPVRSIIPSLKLGDYLSIQAHKPCCISRLASIRSLILLVCQYMFASWLPYFFSYKKEVFAFLPKEEFPYQYPDVRN